MRNKIIAGNWKMFTTVPEAVDLVNSLKSHLENVDIKGRKVILFPPFLQVGIVKHLTGETEDIYVGAQNCHTMKEGAYTGEISAEMIASTGADYVLVGHSERRQYFHETNELLSRKVLAAHRAGIIPVYCCGETLEERESDSHFHVIERQIAEGLFSLDAEGITRVIVAYEPIWAIGTGKTASPEQAQEIHAYIRTLLKGRYGEETAQNISILYGGSVKPANAAELFGKEDIDGALVGGASLKADDFTAIITS